MSNTSNLSLAVDLSSETLFKQYVSVQDSNWKTVDSVVGSISSDVSNLQSAVSSLEESVSTVISYTDNLALRVSTMDASISGALSSISEFSEDLSTVVSNITDLYSLVSNVESSVNGILSSVQDIDLQVSNLQYDVSDLLSSVAYLGEELSNLNSSVSTVLSDIEYLSSSISQLSEYVVSQVTSIIGTLSTIYGSEGSITLFSSLWSNSLYEVSISGFGENDEIVFSAATRSDRSMWMEADPFVVASSDGGAVTFDVLSTPTSDITLFYYINRGMPVTSSNTIVVTTLNASDIHDYTEIYVYYNGVETDDFQIVVSGSEVQLVFSEVIDASNVSYILTNFEWEFGVDINEAPQQIDVNLIGVVSVNWGDGTIDNLTYHTYSTSSAYTVHLNGKINDWGNTFENNTRSLVTTLSFIEPTYSDNIGVFAECSNLYNVSLNSNQKSLAQQMFEDCVSLSSIILPDNLITIGSNCFGRCIALSSVQFNSTLTTIGEYAFEQTALSVVSLPSTVATVGSSAFQSCTSLTTLIIPLPSESMYILDSAFRYCANLSNITFEGTVSQFYDNVHIVWYSISATFDNNVVIHCSDADINYSWTE